MASHKIVCLYLNLFICSKRVLLAANSADLPAAQILFAWCTWGKLRSQLTLSWKTWAAGLWLAARRSLRGRQWKHQIKEDEDPANMTWELNIPTFQEHWIGCFLDGHFGEKQTMYLMRPDKASTAVLWTTMKLKSKVSSLKAKVPGGPHRP